MKLPVTCNTCTREGEWDTDHGFVHHEDRQPGIVRRWACELPPQVKTVPVPRDWYPSPWKMKLRGW